MPDTAPLHPLRAEVIGNELALAWSDGQESYLALEKLRRGLTTVEEVLKETAADQF